MAAAKLDVAQISDITKVDSPDSVADYGLLGDLFAVIPQNGQVTIHSLTDTVAQSIGVARGRKLLVSAAKSAPLGACPAPRLWAASVRIPVGGASFASGDSCIHMAYTLKTL